ncbi:DUF1481 domain-containing protein [Photobacterium nomapromontoriensis]|uniref:DUF1481 domain-containing protein n=1 Tax=Photobacterium nomapromontoriensis TaxID=2910237 RepID=UPI003D111196
MKRLLTVFTLSLLAGCASTPTVPENNITPVLTHTGGQSLGNSTYLYWYTSQQNRPVKLADTVLVGDDGYYQSNYRWRDGQLREIRRHGEQRDELQLKPFSLNVRYDIQGSAVFQRYTLGGDVIPLSNTQMRQLQQDAQDGVEVVKQQRNDDISLVQGYWEQGRFYRCGDNRPLSVTFSPALSVHQAQQLQSLQQQAFMVVTGKAHRNTLDAKALLMLKRQQATCLVVPDLPE